MNAVLFLFALATAPAIAQTAAPAPVTGASTNFAERREAADQLLAVIKFDETSRTMMPKMTDLVFQQLLKGNDARAADLRRIILEEMTPRFGQLIPALHQKARDLYADRFSADELRQLVAFYGSPIGQKAIAVSPQIQLEMFQFGQQAGQAAAQAALPGIIDRMRAANLNIPTKS